MSPVDSLPGDNRLQAETLRFSWEPHKPRLGELRTLLCIRHIARLLAKQPVAATVLAASGRVTAETESQNGRGWKGPLWVTQSNPLPKQGHLQ